MTTLHPHHHSVFAGLSAEDKGRSRKIIRSKTRVDATDRADSITAILVLAYMLSLAALSVIAVTGQFPWFLLTLAGGAVFAASMPLANVEEPAENKASVMSA